MNKVNVLFTPHARADYQYWQQHNRKVLERIDQLIKQIQKEGALEGVGRPEKLKGNLTDIYSRRIDIEHRLIYIVIGQQINIISCRYYY